MSLAVHRARIVCGTIAAVLLWACFSVGATVSAQEPPITPSDGTAVVTITDTDDGGVSIRIDDQGIGTMVVSYGSRTVESTVQEISLSDAMGNGALAAAASTTCWSHFLRGTDDMGSFWTKTVWCANDNAVLTYKNVTEDADQVNWPWVLRDDDAGTTAGGVGHTYHEDVGRAKFELCSPGIDCTGVLDIIKIWKEQYGDGWTDSEVTYEAE